MPARGRVIGSAINEQMLADLLESALAMAVATRGEQVPTVMAHADRGCQYTSG
jgi:putative transposase